MVVSTIAFALVLALVIAASEAVKRYYPRPHRSS